MNVRLNLVLAALLAVFLFKAPFFALPDMRAGAAPGEFDATRAIARLARILGDERPHPVDSAASDAVRARLIAEIEALGYAPETRDDFTCRPMPERARVVCARVRNVVFRAGPREGRAVMVASHYDSTPAGPGAADDGVGVAVSLEIAKLFADAAPARPVIFLMTDGEEAGLLGAHSFVRVDPLAKDIDAVVNLEARGVRGPAQMFETSAPNGADIKAFAEGAARPFANSMMTDVYRLLPNDTDVTEFLSLGYNAVNLALTKGVEYYHTPRDNLAALDPRSVQHMGDLALNSVRNLLIADERAGEEPQLVFTDILSRATVILPQWMGGFVVFASIFVAALAFMRRRGARPIRSALTPAAVLIFAAGGAFAVQALIGAIRPEALYWSAHPEAMRAVAYLSAIAATLVAFKWVGAGGARESLIHAGWFWFALIGAAAYFVAPGSSILFALPLIAYSAGALGAVALSSLFRPFMIVASLIAVIAFIPMLYLAEIGLGFGVASLFAVVAALVIIVVAPLAMRAEARIEALPVAAAFGLLAAAGLAALIAPAYSAAAPAPLNIQLFIDADAREAKWLLGAPPGEPPPRAMRAAATFERANIEGLGENRLTAPAPVEEISASEVTVLSAADDDEGRKVRFALAPNGADAMFVILPEAAGAIAVKQGSRSAPFGADGEQLLFCFGRACEGAEFEITLRRRESAEWLVFGVRYGLPESAAALIAARPLSATPIQNGDLTIVRTRRNI